MRQGQYFQLGVPDVCKYFCDSFSPNLKLSYLQAPHEGRQSICTHQAHQADVPQNDKTHPLLLSFLQQKMAKEL